MLTAVCNYTEMLSVLKKKRCESETFVCIKDTIICVNSTTENNESNFFLFVFLVVMSAYLYHLSLVFKSQAVGLSMHCFLDCYDRMTSHKHKDLICSRHTSSHLLWRLKLFFPIKSH